MQVVVLLSRINQASIVGIGHASCKSSSTVGNCPPWSFGSLFAGSLCTHGQFSRVAEAARPMSKDRLILSPTCIVIVLAHLLFVATERYIIQPIRRAEILGQPYRDVPSTAVFANTRPVPNRPKGSPSIPVGAITRTDGSYIVFSDGSVKFPADPAAAAASAAPGRILMWNSSTSVRPHPGWTVNEDQFTLTQSSGGLFEVKLKEPMRRTQPG